MFSISFNRLENCNPNHGTCPNSELLETVSDFVIDGKVSLTSCIVLPISGLNSLDLMTSRNYAHL